MGKQGKINIPMMLACVLVSASFFALVMVLVDVVYALVDPRIKAKYAKKKK
jgi:peptide/nickel transport system permease protein